VTFAAVIRTFSTEMRYILTAIQVSIIALKLSHVIDWPWWRVLMPTWIPFSAAIVGLAVLALDVRSKRKLRGKE
jgi:hypothetical protein